MPKFEELYNAVFDENGNRRVCGREACTELIDYVDKTFKVNIGNSRLGLITEETTIKKLYADYKTNIGA